MIIYSTLIKNWSQKAPASTENVLNIERDLGVILPDDYKQLLLWSNGGEGRIGNAYLSLWSTTEIVQLNLDYQIDKYMPGFVGIGTDGGGELYAYNFRAHHNLPELIKVPLGDLDTESIRKLGDSITQWITECSVAVE